MAQHNSTGKTGEHIACEYLITQGFTIRETNWRMGKLEIDIVAHKPDEAILHIVEVKTRSHDEHYDPMQAITPAKIRNLVRAANSYINYYQLPMAVQYDVMIMVGTAPNFKIQFIADAFQAPLSVIR